MLPGQHAILEASITAAPIPFCQMSNICNFTGPIHCMPSSCTFVPDWCHLLNNEDHDDTTSCGMKFLLCTVLFEKYDISMLEIVGMFFNEITWFGNCFSGSSLLFHDMTHRLCMNFKCYVTNINRDPLGFSHVKCIYVGYDQTYQCKNFTIYSVREIYTRVN